MAKLKNPLLSLGAVGRLAKDIVFARRRKVDIVEKKPIPLDTKSDLQLEWRHMYQKAVALWHALSASEKQEWESLARPKHMIGFAYFISLALKPNPGLYLPLQGGTMSGNIDMNGNVIEGLITPTQDDYAARKKYVDDQVAAAGYTEGTRVYHNAHQSIPHNTDTILALNSERYDTDAIHDPVTNNSRLTCKTAGKYVIIAQVAFALNAIGYRGVRILLNSATQISRYAMEAYATQKPFFSATTIWDLSVNDFVEIQAKQTSGGALNVEYNPDHSPEFMMQRIG